ncbi:CsxC family protein [Bacillus salacetis]|uniref:CsxC family protein n=1 Tax=Bacillus salacetis TaxID=2315464 RepID=UPI003BA3A840
MSDKHHHHPKQDCVKVNKTANVSESPNADGDFVLVPDNELRIVRVPVQLAAREITTNLVADIHFPEPVMEIKDVKKRVEVVQCRLMTPPAPSADVDDIFSVGPFPLVIKGYVRKNIQYATPIYNKEGNCVASDIKSLTVRVPFETVTNVELDSPVQLPLANTRTEFDYYREQGLGSGFPEKDLFLSSDISQFHQFSTQFYNQLPFCELLSSTILEWDESTNRHHYKGGPVGEGCFDKVVEKMNVTFTVKVLQNQQLEVATADDADDNGNGNGGAAGATSASRRRRRR